MTDEEGVYAIYAMQAMLQKMLNRPRCHVFRPIFVDIS
jgi:hypothetical protein